MKSQRRGARHSIAITAESFGSVVLSTRAVERKGTHMSRVDSVSILVHPHSGGAHWLHADRTREMRKGFTRRPQPDEPGTQGKNYITPGGLQRLKDEHRFLLTRERRAVTEVVAWAASNGDRSENADYQYGKRRLRQIDGRIRFLTKRIDAAEVVDPEIPRAGQAAAMALFGATVRYANGVGTERTVSIVGADEVDL